MKDIRQNRGSVLMEFIIVFPIYLVLFGGVFMIGDMLIKTTRLASADRTRAFDVAATVRGGEDADDSLGWPRIKDYLFPITSIREDNVRNDWYRHYANPNFEGPWTVAVASKVRDEYRLAPWTKGWLAFAKNFLADGTGTGFSDLGEIGGLMDGGNVVMYSKKKDTPVYKNYVSFRRSRFYDTAKLKQLYRAMPSTHSEAGRLVDGKAGSASWNVMAEESWPEVGTSQNSWRRKLPRLDSRVYSRYSRYVEWSE